jgi:hypothetical protein
MKCRYLFVMSSSLSMGGARIVESQTDPGDAYDSTTASSVAGRAVLGGARGDTVSSFQVLHVKEVHCLSSTGSNIRDNHHLQYLLSIEN